MMLSRPLTPILTPAPLHWWRGAGVRIGARGFR